MNTGNPPLKDKIKSAVRNAIGDQERTRMCGCKCGHEFEHLPKTRYPDVAESLAISFVAEVEIAIAALDRMKINSEDKYGLSVSDMEQNLVVIGCQHFLRDHFGLPKPSNA